MSHKIIGRILTKNFLILSSLIMIQGLFSTAFALDVTFQLKTEIKEPASTKMTCAGQTCSCPADTVLDSSAMRCLKCEAGLELNSNQKCTDPKAATEEVVQGWTALSPEAIQTLKDDEASQPSLCDVRTAVEGKFKDCQCSDSAWDLPLNESAKMVVVSKKAFNLESQKCERTHPYLVTIADISCAGPRRGAFDKLQQMGLIKAQYDSPGMSLAMCGATDGNHILQLQKSENMISVLDAIAITATASGQIGRKIKAFTIDPKTVNY